MRRGPARDILTHSKEIYQNKIILGFKKCWQSTPSRRHRNYGADLGLVQAYMHRALADRIATPPSPKKNKE